MADLAGAILHAVLGFTEHRLRGIEQAALGSAEQLASALGGAGLPAADDELVQARADLAACRATLAQPVSLARESEAAAHLGSALRHVERAVELVHPGAQLPDLLGAAFGAPINPTGLAAQLGLSVPGALRLDGSSLSFQVASAGGVSLPGAAPLRAESATLTAALRLDGSGPALVADLALNGLTVAVAGAGFDALVNTLFGSGSSATADVIVGVDSDRGVTVGGATHGPVVIPVKASSPMLEVRGLTLDTPTDLPGVVDLGALVAASLGSVIRLLVDGAGARVLIDPDQIGNGSPVTVTARPPRGVGISLDAGIVRAGGYLDVEDGRYSGVLDVRLGSVEATAFGIVDTRDPSGFSLIVVISAEFFPAIEIALGFTVNGVGGIVGVQRTLDSGALLSRMHDHTVDHLLFPADPTTAAPEILRTLGAVFPPRRGGVVVGPMVKLGWGRPISFVTASVGVVIVPPDPKIVILGTFELAVPSRDLPIIDLKGSVFSEITADHALALVVLEDSRVAGYPVSGDLGFLVGFGDDPSFAISAGGFHPRYQAPRELAAMRRLSIDLSPPIVLTIRATAYVAFTTNSFQLGGRLEAEGDAGPVGLHGFVQLDAIVRWAPSFAFEADLSAGFDMRFAGESFAGVQLRMHLQGPAPWMAHGTATLEIPILPDVDVEVGPITWGDGRNPPPPAAHPLGLVREALSVPEAWRPELPRDADALVTLRSDPADPPLLVHPLGMFEGRQRAVPLETTIARIGPSPVPDGEKRIHLGQPTLSDGGALVDFGAVSGVADHFAPGQFLDLSDDDQLRRPAFEDMPAGIRLGPADGVRTDPGLATQSDLHYDTVYPHQNLSPGRDVFPLLRQSAFAVLAAGAAGRSALRADVRYTSPPVPIVFAPAAEVRIRRVTDLAAPPDLVDQPLTFSHAAEAWSARADASALQLVALGTEIMT